MKILRVLFVLMGLLLLVEPAGGQTPAASAAPPPRAQSKWMGTNLSANDPWSTAAPWCDVCRQMTGWYPPHGAPKPRYDANGYPQGRAMCHMWLYSYPSGTYHLHYRAARNFWVSAKRVRNLHRTPDGAREGDVDFKSGEYVQFEVDGPVSDIHLYAPDARPGRMFRDAFLDYLRPYAVVRLMTWEKPNNGGDGSPPPPIHWANRVKPTDWDQTTRGVAYEFQAELCREAGVQPWAIVHYGADDEYIANEARCFAAQPGKPGFDCVHWEYGNELWNTTLGPQGMQIRKDADASIYGAGDPNQRGARRAAALAAHSGAIARQVLGREHVKVVFGAQAAWNAWAGDGLAWAESERGGEGARGGKTGAPAPPPSLSPSSPPPFDVLAIAPYFQPTWKTPVHSVADLLGSCDQWITTVLEPGLASNKAVADKYHCDLEAYEGGQSLIPVNHKAEPQGNVEQRKLWAQDLSTRAQNDPQMGALYDRLFAVSHKYGLKLFCHFLVVGQWNRWGYWGLYQYTGDPGGVKAQAVRRAM